MNSPGTAALMTAEEYATLPDEDFFEELVRGVVVRQPLRDSVHGFCCANVGFALYDHVRANDLGRVTSNNVGVITERDPDTVRGPDIAFYSFDRLPRGPLPKERWPAVPDLVVEVRPPSDRWPAITAKALEYLAAGVRLIAVLDPEAATLTIYEDDASPRKLAADDEFTAPAVLPGFAAPVRQLLE